VLEKFQILEKHKTFNVNAPGVFLPTGTSRALLSASLDFISLSDRVLDLGCGSGILGLELKYRFNSIKIFMSDVSDAATSIAKQNSTLCNLDAGIKTGSLLDPWVGEKFNIVLSDVSGVIPKIGNYFGWFADVSNESGSDGSDLAVEVIKSVKKFLIGPTSLFIMPIISLSNEKRQLDELKDNFTNVEEIGVFKFPIAKENSDAHNFLASNENVRIEVTAGLVSFTTTIYASTMNIGVERIRNDSQ
jgi:hypothetical protein